MVVKHLFIIATGDSCQQITSRGKTKRTSLLEELKGMLRGEELYDVMSEYDDIVFGFQSSKHKFLGFCLPHNWVKISIL